MSNVPLTPLYGFTAPDGAILAVTPQPDSRPLVEIVADDGRATSVLLYLVSITAEKFAADVDLAAQAAANGDTTVHGSEPRLDVSGDTINVTPGPDDGTGPRVTIAANEDRGEEDGAACVAVEMPVDAAVDLAAAIRIATRQARGEDTQAADEVTMTAVDGRDALAFVIIRPGAEDGAVSIEAAANGMSKTDAAYVLRHVAQQFEEQAAAEQGEQPKGSCPACGSAPSTWCKHCATCPPGCALHGHDGGCSNATTAPPADVPRPPGLDALLDHVAANLPDEEAGR